MSGRYRATRKLALKLVFERLVLPVIELLAALLRGNLVALTNATYKRLGRSINFGSLL
jgi:hypothetical protein